MISKAGHWGKCIFVTVVIRVASKNLKCQKDKAVQVLLGWEAFLNSDKKIYWCAGFVQALFTGLHSAMKMRIKIGEEMRKK